MNKCKFIIPVICVALMFTTKTTICNKNESEKFIAIKDTNNIKIEVANKEDINSNKVDNKPIKKTDVEDKIISTNKKNEQNKISLGKFKLTAYCNCSKCCGKWAGSPTASGTNPKENRTIAVDTNIIPFGTKVMINGKIYIAEDTGSAIKGNKIDIYMNSHNQALNFGVQYTEVFKVV